MKMNCLSIAAWYPSTTQTAKVILQYNMSVVFALRGEYEKAGELLRQVTSFLLWCARLAVAMQIHFIFHVH